MPPPYETLPRQPSETSLHETNFGFNEENLNEFDFKEEGMFLYLRKETSNLLTLSIIDWKKIVCDHQTNACIDVPTFLEARSSIFINNVTFSKVDFDQDKLVTPFLLLSGGNVPNAADPLDESFNRIIDEPLNSHILVRLINEKISLVPFIIDSLKRYHALADIHSLLPKYLDSADDFSTSELQQSFLQLIKTVTTRTLLVVALESLSLESQRFLGNFIRKNDLPLPLSYYIGGQKDDSISYKINFNCLMEVLCFSKDRLCIQAGSKGCATLGKTSLLQYIFTDKRRELLFTKATDSTIRASCIDVLFGSHASSHYVIFDVHGSVDHQRNLSLVRAIQLYASVQLLYITIDDLDDETNFVELMMSTSPQLPTIVCIFDDQFDSELPSSKQPQQDLIDRYRTQCSLNHSMANIHWMTVPKFKMSREISDFERKRRAERLIKTYTKRFEEMESLISARPIFRSIFAIQSTYLLNHYDREHKITMRKARYSVEDKLQELFGHLSDQTENLKLISPISYYQSQIDSIRKKLAKMIDYTEESKRLAREIKQLEENRKRQSQLSAHTVFMINLLKNAPYISLVITDCYLEQWRSLFIPSLKAEKETLKKKARECEYDLMKAEERQNQDRSIDQTKSGANDPEKSHKNAKSNIQSKPNARLQELREQSKRLRQQISDVDAKLCNVDLTIGLMIDELFASYNFLRDEQPLELEKYQADFEQVADKLAQLVRKGYALHILRGRPPLCSSGLMEKCFQRLRVRYEDSLFVVTVVGEQSSAKSSLLNATFGCNFHVSAGRCTIGMYLGVVYYKDMTIAIVDTEGLLSLEESGSIFDNQMITMAVLSSHLVLINHKGELSSTLEGLIGMSLYAKLQIQSSSFKPKLMFVLRDQVDRKRTVFFEQLNKFKDNLQQSSSFLRVSIDDELEIRHENIALLTSAFSEDNNEDLNLTQRWRNQTFPAEINELRANIFSGLFDQIVQKQSGYKNFDSLYRRMSTNWKSIDELGQGLLECRTLYELSVVNELKVIAQDIIIRKSQQLLDEGWVTLRRLLDNRQSQEQNLSDIYLKQMIKTGKQELEAKTTTIVREAHDEFESRTQQKYFATLRGSIQKRMEPSIRCNRELLQQQFENDAYTAARESAESATQKQLLDKAKEFFQRETQTDADIQNLSSALDYKYVELKNEFYKSLDSMRKNDEDIISTILGNYNRVVHSRTANANKHDIYNRCPLLDFASYEQKCRQLDEMFKLIREYLSSKEKSPSVFTALRAFVFGSKGNRWRDITWFTEHQNIEFNKKILWCVLETVMPKINVQLVNMLHDMNLSYSDPQTIMNLINYVDNAMNGQLSVVQQNYKFISLPQITADFILIALRLLIDEAIRISKAKNEESMQALGKLDDWMKNIQEQFKLIKNSSEQGQKFMEDLKNQIIEETIREHKKMATKQINLKITENSQIDPDRIARNAYDNSIDSIPPDGNSIMKYVLDINRYYLELALNQVKLSADHIVQSQILKLQEILRGCVNKAIGVVEKHSCKNVQEVYKSIIEALQSDLPGLKLENLVGISANIEQPDQFRQSFSKIKGQRESMIKVVQGRESGFKKEAERACRTLITQRLGCQSCCPGCGAKCDNTNSNHQNHKSSYHICMAFKGWRWVHNKHPTMELCYQNWLTGSIAVGDQTFYPRRKYFEERAPEWFDDLEEKSKTGDLHNDSIPPKEQRRAWMAVRNALVNRYGMDDQPSYDSELYPTTIESVPDDYQPKWENID